MTTNMPDSSSNLIEDRLLNMMRHPFISKLVVLPTEPINELFKLVKLVVTLHEAGFYATAKSGFGKTRAMQLIEIMLKMWMPSLIVYRHIIDNQQMPSIRGFHKHFLNTVGHQKLSGETQDLRLRLINKLADDGRQSGLSLVVLLIDEAQAMRPEDFMFLKDVANEVEKEDVQLITVLMGQEPDFTNIIDRLKEDRRLDLVARFAMRKYDFRGYNSVDDLTKILNLLDTTRWPEDSGPTYTEFFLPIAFANGFRMQNEAESFFKALLFCSPRPEGDYQYPARPIFMSIRKILALGAGRDQAHLRFDIKTWRDVVNDSHIKDALKLGD